MSDTPLTDDYVAEILQRDAKRNNTNRYLTSGLGSLLGGSRPRNANAPKPNTRFLRNIVKHANSHNAALLKKEEEESRARLQKLREEERARDPRDDRDWKRKEGLSPREKDLKRHRRRSRSRDHDRGSSRSRSPKRQSERDERKRRDREPTTQRRKADSVSESHPSDSRKRKDGPSPRERRHRHRSRSQERRKEYKREHGTGARRSWSPERESIKFKREAWERGRESRRERDRSAERRHNTRDDDSESDPLESVIGPKPPPKALPRGRGAYKSSTMDSRFEASYDPKTDVALEDPGEGDDWDMALEALKDRAKWRKSGADRLRAAGFTEEEVSNWEEGGDGSNRSGEQDISNVRWSKKGEGREWDRGKVVDGGRLDVKADWAKGKET